MEHLETSNAARSAGTGSKLATLGQVKNVLDYSKDKITELKGDLGDIELQNGYPTGYKENLFYNWAISNANLGDEISKTASDTLWNANTDYLKFPQLTPGAYKLFYSFILTDYVSSIDNDFMTFKTGVQKYGSGEHIYSVEPSSAMYVKDKGKEFTALVTINITESGLYHPIISFGNFKGTSYSFCIKNILIFDAELDEKICSKYINAKYYPVANFDDNNKFECFGILPYIKNNQVTLNRYVPIGEVRATYICADLGSNAKTVKCKCKFYGGFRTSVALISQPNSMIRKVRAVTDSSIHIVFNAGGSCTVGIFVNQKLNTVIVYNYTALDLTGSVEYEVGYSVDGNTLSIYLPDGTTKTVTSDLVTENNGRYVVWEHYCQYCNGLEFNHPEFTEFMAESIEGAILRDTFSRFDGALSVSESGHQYSVYSTLNGI